jgi:predicted PurR-regulated permease PerM
MARSKSNPTDRLPSHKLWSTAIPRGVGYGLLTLASFNLLDILIPLRLMDLTWELDTIRALVESAPIPLLGSALVFYGEAPFREGWERLVVRTLSWACLVVGILFLLLIPATASNTIRLNLQITSQAGEQFSQQMAEVDQVEQQLKQASNEQIEAFLRSQGVVLENNNSQDLKQQLLERLNQTRQQVRTERDTRQRSQRLSILKNAVKWIFSAIVVSFLFIYIWRLSRHI